ncbi:MAG: hypothetical protein VX004_13030 [SAR324 cluster bacterium]|nr:hypothetical protein [SAR324 cluster bacterium]
MAKLTTTVASSEGTIIMGRFDLFDRMLELKSEMLAAEQMKDWHKREEVERKLTEVKKMLKEFDERRNP